MKKILWQELCRSEFEAAVKANAVVIIPVGAIEQHGNHLPVDTDASCCFSIAQRAAQAIDEFPVLVLPVIWTGYSTQHIGYPGTITLKFNTFVEVLTQVVASVHETGFRKMLILNGHGGNKAIVAAMPTKLATEEHVSTVIAYTWWLIPEIAEEMKIISEYDKGFIGHAGELETSVQLYLHPELVDAGAAVWDRGVGGDPSTGTHQKGERLVNTAVHVIVQKIRDFHSGRIEYSLRRFPKYVYEGQKTIDEVVQL